MKTGLLVFIFSLSFYSIAQNWNLLDENKTYFYKHIDSAYITNTIKVDSAVISGINTSFHIHKTIKACDNCIDIPSNSLDGMVYKFNVPELFGSVNQYDGSVNTYLLNDGLIQYHSEVGTTWAYSLIPSINAEIVDKYETTVFGQLDSVKVITLSSLDTIIISKNHGVIRYPDFINAGKYYNLVGYHEGANSHGEFLPNQYTIYNFQTNDEFCYHKYYGDSGFNLEWIDSDIKFKILANNSTASEISYSVKYYHIDQHSYFGPPSPEDWWPNYFTSGNLIIELSIDSNKFHMENCYGIYDNLLEIDDFQFYSPIWDLPTTMYYCNDIAGSELAYIDYLPSNYFGYLKRIRRIAIYQDSLCYFPQDYEDQSQIFANGYGSILSDYFCFETGFGNSLQSAVSNGDTLGTICVYPEDLGISTSLKKEILNIYPNPTNSNIFIPSDIQNISLFNNAGEQVLTIENPEENISVSHLPPGIYFVKALDKNGSLSVSKLIIQ